MTLPEPQVGDESERPETDETQPGVQRYRAAARRAPKVGVFLVLGGLLGAVVAAILTAIHGGAGQGSSSDTAISDNGLWVFVVFFFSVGIGVAVGAVVVLILDRVSRRRVSIVTVERGVVEAEPEEVAVEAEPGADAPEEPSAAAGDSAPAS